MKAGWKTVPLGDAVEVIGGGTPSKRNLSFYGGEIPWATVRDMNKERLIATEHSITQAALKASSSKLIPAGEVVIAARVGLGKVCILGQETAINQDLRGLVPKEGGQIDRRFLFYWYQSIAAQVIAAGTGATVQGVKLPFIKALPFPLLSLEEQQRIVAILDEAFDGLDRARANAEANLQNARNLFTAALGTLFADNREHWPLRKVVDVCQTFGRGKSRHRPRNDPRLYGGEVPFIQTGDLSRADHFLREFSQTYSPLGVSQSRVWPKGTVCVAIVGATIGESAILEFEACFPDSIIGMVPDQQKANAEFLDYLLQFIKSDLKEAGKGSARDNINLGTFSDRRFPIPDLKAQIEAVAALGQMNEHCRKLESLYLIKLGSLADLRQSLLQKAFSGELT